MAEPDRDRADHAPARYAALVADESQPNALTRSCGVRGIGDVGLHHSRRAAARALHQP